MTERLGAEIEELRALAAALSSMLSGTQRMVDENCRAFGALSRELDAIGHAPAKEHDGAADVLTELAMRLERKVNELAAQLQDMGKRASALENRVAEWRDKALTDSLTRLPNRRAGEERLNEVLAALRNGASTPMTVALADIDRFKSINDTHGHLVGDAVLRFVALTLRTGLRQEDLVVRWGGEEFLIILHNQNLTQAQAVCERLRKAIESRIFKLRESGETIGRVTISMGLTPLRRGDTPQSVLNRADQALYAAKSGGRNTLRVAHPDDDHASARGCQTAAQ